MNIIIGQYIPGDSLIHRLDPRVKITIIFFFIIIVFFANNFYSYLLLITFLLAILLLAKIPFRYLLRGLIPVWFLIVFTFLLHLFFTKGGTVLVEIFHFQIYSGGILQGIKISLRFFLLIMMTSLLTFTTTPIEITDAIEMMLYPLQKIKFPTHEFALMMSIALRFIPTLMEETDKISKAQASRGVDFRTGPIKERIKAVVPLLIPLFMSAFERAEELAMAMEARGYRGGKGRTKLRALKLTKIDYMACLLYLAVIASLFVVRSY